MLLISSRVSAAERRALSELAELRKEEAGISMVKEFAKAARLQRKINALSDQLKTESKWCIRHVVTNR